MIRGKKGVAFKKGESNVMGLAREAKRIGPGKQTKKKKITTLVFRGLVDDGSGSRQLHS